MTYLEINFRNILLKNYKNVIKFQSQSYCWRNIIAKEKGLNAYVRVDDRRCSVASNWWKDNTRKWSIVRAKWNEIYLRNKDLALETKVNNKVLYKHLFDDSIKEKKQIYPLIESFVK